ncbi:hydroxymethylbilane synthase [Paracrocinitomix mangrovi]|uniref:hydroxymethylbilane synthase n=1 Tax=Paracrocinitomix mangrovi TaxID=2862509 RepID=UPI001C8DA59D|nr:hydroxymethylbilane synthase [Paracrocinitomix mangrovi]UKN00790.1 hydroxymethylbilane synthase [Paracrocinitomix mangrovi]
MNIRIGSRGSDLALWQANFVKDELTALGHEVEIIIIETKGDKIQDLSFDKIEGKGFFTKEIEAALIDNEIDLAVHSHKDLETTPPEGLVIAAVSARANPVDVLLVRKEAVDEIKTLDLKDDPIVGTSSARRQTQLRRLRSDVQLKDLRGNVPTRINKLRNGDYDAIVLAAAGVQRLELDLSDLHVIEMDPTLFIPAPAQGVLGLQVRDTDSAVKEAVAALNNVEVGAVINIERGILRGMEGGCQLPLGVHCYKEHGDWVVYTAYCKDKNGVAEVNSYQSEEIEGLVELIVDDLKDGIS